MAYCLRRFMATVIGLLLPVSMALAASSAAVPLDKVVAVVNTGVITQSQLDSTINDLKAGLKMSGAPMPTDAELRKRALDQLIAIKLQLDLAARNKITVSDKEVADAIAKIAAQNHLTPDQLKTAVAQQGINYNRFRQQIHDQILIHSLQQHLFAGNVKIGDQEVKDFMKKAPNLPSANSLFYVDDLVIPLSETASAADVTAAQKTAQTLLTQAQQGKAFGELASTAAASAHIQHTDLGWRKLSDLPTIFAQAVATMKVNSVQGPIRAPNGFHLLKVLSVRGQAGPLTEAEAKNMLFQQKIQTQIDSWLQQVRKSAYVKIM